MESARDHKDQKKPPPTKQSFLDQFIFKKPNPEQKSPQKSQEHKTIPLPSNPNHNRDQSPTSSNSIPLPVKKIKLDEKVSDNSEEYKTIHVNPNPAPQNVPTQKLIYYTFPHTLQNWPRLELKLKLIAEGKTSIEQILTIIEANIVDQTNVKNIDTSILKKYIFGLDSNTRQYYKDTIFPCIARLALKTSKLFENDRIPLFTQGIPQKVTFSKEQCACLVANMMMGLTVQQVSQRLCRHFNFYNWYKRNAKEEKVIIEKLKCLFNYFVNISKGIPDTFIHFHRLVLSGQNQANDWKACQVPLQNVVLDEQAKIEDSKDCIEVDFANQYLGGWALIGSMAQEEIIFTVNPECFVGILFNECMREDEGILMQGVEPYSSYRGYRDFVFAGPKYHSIPVTAGKSLNREILAIDAINLRDSKSPEYTVQGVLRELNKAYVGFRGADDLNPGRMKKKTIATGRWGCGVFKANVQLKFIVQWVAASRAERDMLFCSFGDKKVKDSWKILNKYKGMTVGVVVRDMLNACEILKNSGGGKKDLFSLMLGK